MMLINRFAVSLASTIFFISILPITGIAQDAATDTSAISIEEAPLLYTEIVSPNFAEVASPVIFTASPQFNIEDYNSISYLWDFGDGNADEGKEVAHTFARPGNYQVRLNIKADKLNFVQNQEVFVALKAALLISDRANQSEKIQNRLSFAKDSNIYIKLVESFSSKSEFLSEEVLANKLIKLEDTITKIDTIIVWTDGGAGLNALSRFQQALKKKNTFKNTTIIVLTDAVESTQRIKRQFNQLDPKEILVVQDEGFFQFIDTPDMQTFKSELVKSGFEFKEINQQKIRITPFNLLSTLLGFLTEKGIPDNAIMLILLIPLIATVIALMKQVIGITTLGIYTPTILTLTFLLLGLQFGIVILFFIILMGALAYRILKPLKLLYIPKMALILTAVAIIIFLLLALTVYLNLFEIEFISLAIFPVVIMGTLTEKFVSIRSEKGLSSSILIMVETFFVAVVAYFLAGGAIDLYFFSIEWDFFQNLVLNTPEITIVFILINLYLGRWTGLRLTEYFEFRDVIKNIEE